VFRDFLANRKGSRKGFWLPLWVTDYASYENLQGGTAIKIPSINLANVFVADEQFAFLALIDRSQDIEPHEIVSVTDLGSGNDQLNLAEVIVQDFDPDRTLCCGLIYARLSDDSIKYRYLSDGVVECALEFSELPKEYLAAHEGSTPIFLYELTRSGFTWRMCNWPEPIVVDDECFSPDNIRHGSLRSGIDFLSEDLELEIATDRTDHPLSYYLRRAAFEITELQIWETNGETFPFNRNAPFYKGRINKVDFPDNGQIKAVCSSILRLSELQLPLKQQQRTCNNRLYDLNCGVSPALYEITGVVSGITETYIEATAFQTEATARGDAQWFALGKVVVGVEKRMITGQDAGKLYLDEAFVDVQIGDTVTAWPGCNKRVDHCDMKFNNIENMSAMPYAPNANPQFENLLHPKATAGKK
jgi:hypothetical protein